MDNTLIDFLRYIWPILALPIGWLFKIANDLREDQSLMKKDHYETKLHAAETYVSKGDYRDDLKSLHLKMDAHAAKNDANMQKILDKLDGKQDKSDARC